MLIEWTENGPNMDPEWTQSLTHTQTHLEFDTEMSEDHPKERPRTHPPFPMDPSGEPPFRWTTLHRTSFRRPPKNFAFFPLFSDKKAIQQKHVTKKSLPHSHREWQMALITSVVGGVTPSEPNPLLRSNSERPKAFAALHAKRVAHLCCHA